MSNFIFVSDDLDSGDTLTVSYGGSYSGGTVTDSVCSGGSYSDGTELTSMTLSSGMNTYGSSGMGGDMGGNMGGGMGGGGFFR